MTIEFNQQQNPQQRTGFRDGISGAARRVYKSKVRQDTYNKYYEFGRKFAAHGTAQKLADSMRPL